jgi:hypothetical protein
LPADHVLPDAGKPFFEHTEDSAAPKARAHVTSTKHTGQTWAALGTTGELAGVIAAEDAGSPVDLQFHMVEGDLFPTMYVLEQRRKVCFDRRAETTVSATKYTYKYNVACDSDSAQVSESACLAVLLHNRDFIKDKSALTH